MAPVLSFCNREDVLYLDWLQMMRWLSRPQFNGALSVGGMDLVADHMTKAHTLYRVSLCSVWQPGAHLFLLELLLSAARVVSPENFTTMLRNAI
jgi:hypothetical protein